MESILKWFCVFVFIVNVSGDIAPPHVLKAMFNLTKEQFISQLIRGNESDYNDEVIDRLWPTEEASIPDAEGVGVVAAMLTSDDDRLCSPKDVTVALPKDSDPSVYKYPMCVTLPQCGGCCGGDMFECAATSTQKRVEKVIKNRYDIELGGFVFMGLVDEVLHEHTACECRCRVRAEHCHDVMHFYDEDSCRCVCVNEHIASTCASNRRWDQTQCDCVCINSDASCEDDEYFSEDSCRCEGLSFDQDPIDDVVDPCLGLRCRAGFRMTSTEDGCRCILTEYWGIGVEAASADKNEYAPTRRPTTTLPAPTDTTVAPTPARRRRPRPTTPPPNKRRRRPRPRRS